ncbi:hypothetical protein ACHAW5_004433 [Stephanodiscus triporus]|uniref:Uncharacterized protein n=1 Tax=Stephanodiscus triporus TaxID=2934178 RepID=A0ABD3Q9W2_9STRA
MSDDESSSSEDLPLSALGKKLKKDDSDEAEFEDVDDDEDDDMGKEPNDDSDDFIVEDDDDDDDDDEDGDYNSDSSDDVPLSSLKSPQKKATKVKPAAKKSTSAKKDAPKKKATKKTETKTPVKKKKSMSAKKASKVASSTSASANYLCASSELYSQCDKGKLIQSLLVRWWYAYQWPDPKTLPASTPKGYDALDGFPGVYICTQGSNVGKFLDKRDRDQAPSFKNFAKKNSEELKDMLLRAIERQLKDLIKYEGEGTDAEKNLKVLEKWTMKLNCSKADKEAEKVLKAKRLTLP